MKITVITSNQLRHISLIEHLAGVADEVCAIQECKTLFPGENSGIMEQYFERVVAAEKEVFGDLRFLPKSVIQLPFMKGDLEKIELHTLQSALNADFYVVFGAGYAVGPLCDFLIRHNAIDIHMGVSPYYCGGASNFWAMYDQRPDYVGATIQLHSEEMDAGPILFHVFPKPEEMDPFLTGMKAAQSAQIALVEFIESDGLRKFEPVEQDVDLRIRQMSNEDFTEEVAEEYLSRLTSPSNVKNAMLQRDMSKFIHPQIV
jgi:hypothetical protein